MMVVAGLLSVTGIAGTQQVFAAGTDSNEQTSSITISIIEGPLRLMEVTAPEFGVNKVTGEEQHIHSLNDIVINVSDERKNKEAPWIIRYELTMFHDKNDEKLGDNVTLSLGQGILQSDDANMSQSGYASRKLELYQGGTEQALQANSSAANNYTYVIPKEKILLNVPADIHKGKYEANQIVTLLDIPAE